VLGEESDRAAAMKTASVREEASSLAVAVASASACEGQDLAPREADVRIHPLLLLLAHLLVAASVGAVAVAAACGNEDDLHLTKASEGNTKRTGGKKQAKPGGGRGRTQQERVNHQIHTRALSNIPARRQRGRAVASIHRDER
jgi:hypothetical protein